MSKIEVVKGFTENASATLDAKGRCSLPKDLRKFLKDDNHGEIVIALSYDKTLTIFPALEWNNHVAKLEKRAHGSKGRMLAYQAYMKFSSVQKLDGQSRFTINKDLLSKVGIEKEIFFIGANQTILAMNQTEFDRRSEPDLDTFEDLLIFDEDDD